MEGRSGWHAFVPRLRPTVLPAIVSSISLTCADGGGSWLLLRQSAGCERGDQAVSSVPHLDKTDA